MQKYAYKSLLLLLKALVYLKRFVFWLGSIIGNAFLILAKTFQNTIGFRIYKIKFQLQKYSGKLRIPWDNRLIELIGKRNVLQIIIFTVIFVIMIPHSNLYSQNTNKIPGRDTLLYDIVGPGEQDFAVEEISIDFTTIAPKNVNTWNQGAVQAQTGKTTDIALNQTQQNISSITSGGTAVSKPNIISGATIQTNNNITGRTDTILYTVQTGDTIGQIAEKYNIDVATILWSNNLTTRSYIKPGDELKILPTSGLSHTVKKGDTVSKIAKTYDSDVDKIIQFNKLKDDGSDIAIGEELIIPGGTKPKPIPTYTPPAVRQYTQLSSISAPPSSVSAPAGSGYLWPAGSKIITQYYSWRHTAIDIGGKMGTPIYASRAGTIITSQCGWNGGYGCYIKIDHGGGVQTLYAHNSQLLVNVGDNVSQGQTIALMGNTGNVRGITGIHLHFEIRINGVQVNPLSYVR